MGCLMLRHLLCCAALRRGLAQGDAYARRMQPRYHVAPERNWLNDPNGLAQVDGVYHVFFQHNERAPTWGNIVWGHATSTDLARWTREPPILRDPPPYEAGGAWSGSLARVGGRLAALYTCVDGARANRQCAAFPEDATLRRWVRARENPVVAAPPPGVPGSLFRDPTEAFASVPWP